MNNNKDEITATVYINNVSINRVAEIIIDRILDAFNNCEDFIGWLEDDSPKKPHKKQENNVYRMKKR